MVYLHLYYSSRLHAIDIKIVKFIAQRTAKHNRVLENSALRIFTLHHIHRASSSKWRRDLSLTTVSEWICDYLIAILVINNQINGCFRDDYSISLYLLCDFFYVWSLCYQTNALTFVHNKFRVKTKHFLEQVADLATTVCCIALMNDA